MSRAGHQKAPRPRRPAPAPAPLRLVAVEGLPGTIDQEAAFLRALADLILRDRPAEVAPTSDPVVSLDARRRAAQ